MKSSGGTTSKKLRDAAIRSKIPHNKTEPAVPKIQVSAEGSNDQITPVADDIEIEEINEKLKRAPSKSKTPSSASTPSPTPSVLSGEQLKRVSSKTTPSATPPEASNDKIKRVSSKTTPSTTPPGVSKDKSKHVSPTQTEAPVEKVNVVIALKKAVDAT